MIYKRIKVLTLEFWKVLRDIWINDSLVICKLGLFFDLNRWFFNYDGFWLKLIQKLVSKSHGRLVSHIAMRA